MIHQTWKSKKQPWEHKPLYSSHKLEKCVSSELALKETWIRQNISGSHWDACLGPTKREVAILEWFFQSNRLTEFAPNLEMEKTLSGQEN